MKLQGGKVMAAASGHIEAAKVAGQSGFFR